MTPPKIIIIAGPNGAGKTTFDGLERQAMTTPKPVNELLPTDGQLPPGADADVKGSMQAMQRAALRARQVAQQTGTDLIVVRAGQIVHVRPQQKAAS